MRKIILILTLLFSLQSFGQMSKDIKEPELYVEPQSIQSIKDVWVSEKDDNRKTGIVMVVGGLTMVGLDVYEGSESWKRPTKDGWIYRPFISQSTRPFMMLTGIGLTGTGIGILLYNR
jgi:uncharacterized protein (DUF2126 family)